MLVGKIFKLFRKLTENNRMSTGSYVPPSNSIPPPPYNSAEISVDRMLKYNELTGEWSFNNTKYRFPMSNIDGYVVETVPPSGTMLNIPLCTTVSGSCLLGDYNEDGRTDILVIDNSSRKELFRVDKNKNIIVKGEHTVDIEQEKLLSVEDKGRYHRYYGKGETRINFIKYPKKRGKRDKCVGSYSLPKNVIPSPPPNELIEKDKDRVIRLQNRKVLAEEEHERLLNKMDEWPEEPKIIKEY